MTISSLGYSQSRFQGTIITTDYSTELNPFFEHYMVYEFDSEAISDFVKSDDFDNALTLVFDDYEKWDMTLFQKNMRSDDWFLTVHGPKHTQAVGQLPVSTFSGYVKDMNNTTGSAALTINNGFILGAVEKNDRTFYIEPLNKLIDGGSEDLYIVYKAKDVKDLNITCAVNAVHNHTPPAAAVRVDECYEAEIGVAADNSMFDEYGSVGEVVDYVEAIWLLVNDDYTGDFADDVEFVISTTFVVTGSDPNDWTTTTNAGTLLDNFADWGQDLGFGTSGYDIGQLWTQRNISGTTVGVAYLGVVCTSARYQLIEDIQSSSNTMRQLVSHETGHNFNASHDASGSSDIMAPAINGSDSWSANSISSVSSHIASRTCFDDCLKCLEIGEVTVVDCDNGVYSVQVSIEHNRNPGTSGSITVNGATSSFTFASSPQTINVSGLVADGSQGATITVEDPNDNDSECTQVTTFNVPFPGCFCTTVQSENFNDCSIPAGWVNNALGSNSSADWDFGPATLGVNAPEGNIDGTCMAFFDDDAIDDTGGNGEANNGFEAMELITSAVDIENFENVTLDFDYNFWTFDGDDLFKVDVWNGVDWINIFSTNSDDCGQFGCTTPHFNLAIDEYRNPNFQVRFIYDDQGTWQWYVAIDNFEVCGFELEVLALDINSFEGKANDCVVDLNWEFAQTGTTSVELQRSATGSDFETISTFGTSTERSFEYKDNTTSFQNYYRLKQIDLDGSIAYSEIILVESEDCGNLIQWNGLYPNPTYSDVSIDLAIGIAGELKLDIFNALGSLIHSEYVDVNAGKNVIAVNTNDLPNGVYFVKAALGDFSTPLKKIIKY